MFRGQVNRPPHCPAGDFVQEDVFWFHVPVYRCIVSGMRTRYTIDKHSDQEEAISEARRRTGSHRKTARSEAL